MKKIIIILSVLSFSACSIFQTSEEEKQSKSANETTDEVYVFDEVTENESNSDKKVLDKKLDAVKEKPDEELDVFEETVSNPNTLNNVESAKFYLQLGAFSTLKRAEIFVNEIDSKIDIPLSIMYNPKTSLYNVRSKPYNTKSEVEVIKNNFWNRNMFKDAFIVNE